ncbi:MAG: type II toxin-antitoxin system VapB family antitoxin [Rhodocyclaceae bacterium]
MKTTIEISDALLEQARRLAAREHTTLGALVEQGLRNVIAERNQSAEFCLRRAGSKGNGLQPSMRDTGWDRLREMAYEGCSK